MDITLLLFGAPSIYILYEELNTSDACGTHSYQILLFLYTGKFFIISEKISKYQVPH